MDCKLGFGENMKAAVFGCSWTHGVGQVENYLSWPQLLDTSYSVKNYAVAGSSVLFQIHMLEWVKQNDPADRYIFQITRPERITYWNDNVDWNLHLQGNTVMQFDHSVYKDVQIATIQSTTQSPDLTTQQSTIDLAKAYYKVMNDEAFVLEYKLAYEYINNNVDFCYLQTEGKERKLDLPCIEDILGQEQCKKWWASGTHFGREGLQWTANWVKDNAGL